jgi:hypothetical protein
MAGLTATEQFSALHRKSIPLVGDRSELCEAGSSASTIWAINLIVATVELLPIADRRMTIKSPY